MKRSGGPMLLLSSEADPSDMNGRGQTVTWLLVDQVSPPGELPTARINGAAPAFFWREGI